MRLTAADVRTIFSRHHNLIATCSPGVFPDDHRKMLLLEAIRAGAAFVDVEVDAPTGYREEIMGCAKSGGCAIIVSFHDYARTPGREELASTVSACFSMGADIAKIACMVLNDADNARLLGLLDDARKIVVVGMGEMGRITRIAAPLLGSPFTLRMLRRWAGKPPTGRSTMRRSGPCSGHLRRMGAGQATDDGPLRGCRQPRLSQQEPCHVQYRVQGACHRGGIPAPCRFHTRGNSYHRQGNGPSRSQRHNPLQDRYDAPS